MKASLFTVILATTVLSGAHAALAANGLYKHDASIARYSYNLPIIDSSTAINAGGSLRDDIDKGYKPDTSSTYKPAAAVPAPKPVIHHEPEPVPAPAQKVAPAMPTPVTDSHDDATPAADVKADIKADANINGDVTTTPSKVVAPLPTPNAATPARPDVVSPSAINNNAAFGNVLNPVPAAPAPVSKPAAPVAPQSSATPPAAPAVTGSAGITVSGTGTSTPAGTPSISIK